MIIHEGKTENCEYRVPLGIAIQMGKCSFEEIQTMKDHEEKLEKFGGLEEISTKGKIKC